MVFQYKESNFFKKKGTCKCLRYFFFVSLRVPSWLKLEFLFFCVSSWLFSQQARNRRNQWWKLDTLFENLYHSYFRDKTGLETWVM
jgi:hypothetical protein